jgi:two-component system, sensor histidine kinase PdtaS
MPSSTSTRLNFSSCSSRRHSSIANLGLIVGELITNSLKHAFAADEEGRIEIALTSIAPGMAELEYSDSGKPFPVSPSLTGSGTQLIAALAAQLGGSVSRTNEPGKRISIRFPIEGPR